MALLFFYFFLAVFVSFLCSLLESVLLSISPAYIAVAKQKKKNYASFLSDFKENIDKPLTAVVTLNTLANMIGATGVGAQALKVYGNAFVAISSLVLTLTVLIFSEIFPKILGTSKWKTLAPFATYIILALIFLMYPFVFLSKTLNRMFNSNNSALDEQKQVTREEMIVTAEMGASEGSIRHREGLIIKNLLMLDAVKVVDIMTPRSVILSYSVNEKVKDVLKKNKIVRFSRIPLYKKDLDHVEGVLHRYKLMDAASHDLDDLPIRELMKPVHSIPENISVAAALDQFIKRKEHLFLVVDEYGSTTGLVTLEDAIETLLGVEIMDEFDSIEDMREFALEKWRIRKREKRMNEDRN